MAKKTPRGGLKAVPAAGTARLRPGRRKLTEEEIAVADTRLRRLLFAWADLTTGDAGAYFRKVLRVDDLEPVPVGRLLAAALMHEVTGIVPLGHFVGAAAVFPQGQPSGWLQEHAEEATIKLHVIKPDRSYAAPIFAHGLIDAVDRLRLIALEQEKLGPAEPTHAMPRPTLQQIK